MPDREAPRPDPFATARHGARVAGRRVSELAVLVLFFIPGPLLDVAKTAGQSLLGG